MPANRASAGSRARPETPESGDALLTSKENRWLKRFRAALAGDSGERNLYGIEGPHLVEEALRSGVEIEAILASPSGEKHLAGLGLAALPSAPASSKPRVFRTTDRLFAQIAATEAPQGIAVLVRLREYAFDDLVRGVALIVVLVGVQDPGNVGTIVRSAEAFGATGVVAAAESASPYGPKAMRASAGSVFRMPIVPRAQAPILMAQLRVAGVRLVATAAASVHGAAPLLEPQNLDWREPVALLVGSEAHGLPDSVLRSAETAVRIPLSAPVESLNAAVAASVLLYEAARQRSAFAAGRDNAR